MIIVSGFKINARMEKCNLFLDLNKYLPLFKQLEREYYLNSR